MDRTPLDRWIGERIGSAAGNREAFLRRLDAHRIAKIRETLRLVKERSPFYRERLASFDPDSIDTLQAMERIPFTTPADLRSHGSRMVCLPQNDISRIVTLPTSGTTEEPKRVHFSAADQELTVDFFHHGMTTFTRKGDRVLILMPGERPGSVGDLLARGLSRFGAKGLVHGAVVSLQETWNLLSRLRPEVIVGLPRQVAALAKYGTLRGLEAPSVREVLLSADLVPRSVVALIGGAWACRVHEHYGMTETGLGAGVSCAAREGYHLREADLWFEIVDPESGSSAAIGSPGEIVFTTLTRTGMPLIRYRTGDRGMFLPDPCPCGSLLPRLSWVEGRLEERIDLPGGGSFSRAALDEILLGRLEVFDYTAIWEFRKERACLSIELAGGAPRDPSTEAELEETVRRVTGRPDTDLDIAFQWKDGGDRVFPGPIKGVFTVLRPTPTKGRFPLEASEDG